MPSLWRWPPAAANVKWGDEGHLVIVQHRPNAAGLPLPEKTPMEEHTMRQFSTSLAATAALIVLSASAHAQITMKASHQCPGGKGDVRDAMVQMIAKDVKAANVGIDIQVYPGASLFKPNDQWNAMVNGQLDITLFPLDYASGKVPAFSATLMPGLIRSQERAKRVNNSQFMKDGSAAIEQQGVIVLSDAW